MQQFILMPKKTKKQRQALGFKTIELSPKQQDFSQNNSSSIIANQYQHQSSMQQLSVSPPPPQLNIICIKPRKTLDFQDNQQEQQSAQNKKQKTDSFSYGIIPSMSQLKFQEEQESQQNQKKQTVTTNNQQRRSEFKQQNQTKIQTEHYSYQDSQQNSSSSQYQEKQEKQQQMNKKQKITATVQKSFVAESLEDLIFSQIPVGCSVSCAVNFDHKLLSTTRQYKLYLISEKKYLISAIKNRLALSSQFSFVKNANSNKQEILGELKSNFTGIQYIVNKFLAKENRFSEQCWVGYDFNVLGLARQRNMTILRNKNAKLEKIPFFSQIKNYYENGVTDKFQKLTNKQAVKNKDGDYVLDFHGKVTSPSVKNFIIIDQKQKECILFGKRTNNTFILQVGHPFSIFQGFAIAVSNLDRKLCVR